MAELVLSTVGRAIGAALPGAFGTIGAVIGQVGGAMLGSAIDRQLFGVSTTREGPRLTDLHIQGSTEGASIPAVFGSVRIAGQVIWAARFKEHVLTEEVSAGGKGGGPSVTTRSYRYSLSFAVGLCEGEVARIGRVWANGAPLDLSTVAWRLHTGSEDQAPDPIIEAIDGAENAPAYRGLAYIVFEDIPLEAFGNTIPQLSFEIVRPARADGERFEDRVRGVCLIPGAGEFVYATEPVFRRDGPGAETPENLHAESARANLLVSLDQLQADFPNCETVMLVVAWFGDDLRCGECEIRPGVEIAEKRNTPQEWQVSGALRSHAHLISTHDGGPAFGGTPSDRSVLQAIAELKQRGFKVGLYPFLMMDVPAENELPDPYGGDHQAAYPWRGRINVHPASGEAGTVDQTSAAADQIDAFFGAAAPEDFTANGDGLPLYAGAEEWRYRRFILHHAKLAEIAGGVDAFIIGSEMRGLTTARESATNFPAVAAFRTLAADARNMLGAETTITYAADWSEYSGHRPSDGSNDVFFHLDPLWADDNINVVGIDWYPPLTDWRSGESHADSELATDIHDLNYLRGRIEAGENYDWYYADLADRAAQVRTSITDGAYDEPWVHRAKDVRNFWANAHHDRPGGVRAPTPTAWLPESKPIWFIELGCAAVDKASNQPNVFVDPKSSESAEPFFSTGARDDLIQRRVLEAYLSYWADEENNPVSALTGKPMIEEMSLWAWDARPYPAFPARTDVWSDGAAWARGHWLNGRAGLSDLGQVVVSLCARADQFGVDANALRGAVSGYVMDSPASVRDALEPLMAAFDFSVCEREGVLTFFHPGASIHALDLDDLTAASSAQTFAQRDATEAPLEARIRFIDASRDYLLAGVSARRRDRVEGGVATIEAPLVLETNAAEAIAQRVLADRRAAMESLQIAVGPAELALEAGDRVAFNDGGVFEIARIEDAEARQMELRRARSSSAGMLGGVEPSAPPPPQAAPTPAFAILDLPPLPNDETEERPLAAVFASPWLGQHEIYAGPTQSRRASVTAPAIMGELLWALWPGPVDRWDQGNVIRIALYGGALASVTRDDVLSGANAFAIENNGEYEIIQAAHCELIEPGIYELRSFLRGRQGSAHAMAAPHPIGARIIKLDQRLARANIATHEWGEALHFIAPPSGAAPSSNRAASADFTLPHAAIRPWAPAHLRAARDGAGDVAISWVRCARTGGDSWGPGEPPLGFPTESYVLEILDGGVSVRTETVDIPTFIYTSAAQTADFGSLPGSLHIRAAQIGESGATGLNSELTITL